MSLPAPAKQIPAFMGEDLSLSMLNCRENLQRSHVSMSTNTRTANVWQSKFEGITRHHRGNLQQSNIGRSIFTVGGTYGKATLTDTSSTFGGTYSSVPPMETSATVWVTYGKATLAEMPTT